MLKANLDGAVTFVTYERVATTNPTGVIDAESKSRWSCYFRALCSYQASLHFMISGENCKENVEWTSLGKTVTTTCVMTVHKTSGHVNRHEQELKSGKHVGSVQELHFNPTHMKRCLLLVWVIQRKWLREFYSHSVFKQSECGNIINGQRSTIVDNGYIVTMRMTM